MKINKLIASMTLCAGAFALTGCNDMDQFPRNDYTDANFWTEENAVNLVMNLYDAMYGSGWIWDWEQLSDNLWTGYRSGNEEAIIIRRGLAKTNTGRFGWGGYYGDIARCHFFLEHVDNFPEMDEAKTNRLLAEARYLRDWKYFRAATLWGDIPFFFKQPTLEETYTMARTPHAQVIAALTEDLEDLLPYLPKKDELPTAERGRLTQACVAMLLARIALQESDWANVEKWTKKIMDGEYGHYELFPSYEGLFLQANEYNDEVILDKSYKEHLRTWGFDSHWVPRSLTSNLHAVYWTPTQSLVDCYLTLGGYRWDEPGTDFDPENPYANRDPRLHHDILCDGDVVYDWATGKTQTIYVNRNKYEGVDGIDQTNLIGNDLNQNESTFTGYYIRKYFDDMEEGSGYSCGLNLMIMRYADVLLMYAEAMQEQGKMNEQVWNQTIRPIRARAGFTADKALNFPAGADLRSVIRNERRVELVFEGSRYFDIMRWRAGKEYLDGPVKGCEFLGGNAVLDNYKFDESRDYLWAVSQSQLDMNPNLKQNPGY